MELNQKRTVYNCKNYGKIEGDTLGGVIGNLSGKKDEVTKIENCYNYGEVIGKGVSGGIIGGIGHGDINIKNSYNIGKISSSTENLWSAASGGIVGKCIGRRLGDTYSFRHFKLF